MDEMAFASLFRRAKAGDESAREVLYRLALRQALAAVRKRLAPQDRVHLESQDLRQSVLIRLHRRLPDLSFDDEHALAAWLAETTTRLLKEKRRNWLRKRRDVRRNVPFPTEGLPDRALISIRKALTLIVVEESLDKLPSEVAAVVRLRALEGHSFREVADRLGLAGADAARKRYARAIVKLGSLLGPDAML